MKVRAITFTVGDPPWRYSRDGYGIWKRSRDPLGSEELKRLHEEKRYVEVALEPAEQALAEELARLKGAN